MTLVPVLAVLLGIMFARDAHITCDNRMLLNYVAVLGQTVVDIHYLCCFHHLEGFSARRGTLLILVLSNGRSVLYVHVCHQLVD